MTVDIREVSGTAALHDVEHLFAVVWDRPDEPPIDSSLLKALAHSGNYVAAAYVDGHMTGALAGWLGRTPPDALHLHSHILGVLPGSEARGLGFELKQHQRRWCLERGIKTIEWTTDPLVRRNGYFNLSKLGAEASRYLVNFYGEMIDGLNAGEESDRILIAWRLDSGQAMSAAAGHPAEVNVDDLLRQGAAAVLSVGPVGEPVTAPASELVLLCQVPEDIVDIRRTDPALARGWRIELRAAITGAFASGYRVSGATRSGWYVLNR